MLPAHTLIHIDSAQPFQVPARKWFIYRGLTSRGLYLPRLAGFFLPPRRFRCDPWTGLPGGLK